MLPAEEDIAGQPSQRQSKTRRNHQHRSDRNQEQSQAEQNFPNSAIGLQDTGFG
jgi:hypothetical protein